MYETKAYKVSFLFDTKGLLYKAELTSYEAMNFVILLSNITVCNTS